MSPSAPGPALPAGWLARPYHQLLRGPRHRWWRPLLGLAVLLAAGGLLFATAAVGVLVLQVTGAVDVEELLDPAGAGPGLLLANNLSLAALIPVAALATRVGQGWRPGWMSSVVGRLRWGWMVRVALVCLAVQGVGTAALLWADGVPGGRGQDVVVLLLVVALTTPLQAAGEEYLFRGWLTQAVGSLFAGAVVGAVVSGLVSATLFALAHGQQDAYLFADRFAFGVLASLLTWVTGGLEAAIAAHAVNNVVVFVPVISTGGLAEALTTTSLPWQSLLLDVVLMALTAAAVAVLARRRRLARLHLPPPPPPSAARPAAPQLGTASPLG